MFAFEITADDVANAVRQHLNKDILEDTAETILNSIDQAHVEKLALRSTNFDTQIQYAYESIAEEINKDPELLSLVFN